LSIDGTNKEGRIAFQIVKGCKSTDFPDGNASIAWTRLKAKYASTTAPSLLKQKREYDLSRIKPGQDPDEWITNLEEQRARLKEMNFNITDEDFEIHVLNNLSDAYDIEVSRMEDKLEAGSLTIDKMRESLSLRYERMINRAERSDEETEEQALAAGQFKGRCSNCGKYGHKAKTCMKKYNTNSVKTGASAMFKGKCNYCHETGHMKRDCGKWKAKQGESLNTSAENQESSQSEEEEEEDLTLMCIPEHDFKCAENSAAKFTRNTWICDSGASCHMINNDTGMYDVQIINESVTVGNGQSATALKVGSWKGVVTQVDGTTQMAIFKNVKYVPELMTSLFSLTAAVKSGCKLGNEGLVIMVSKGPFVVKFDRIFKTKSGFIAGVDILPEIVNIGMPVFESGREIDFSLLHKVLNHVAEDSLRKTAKYFKWKICGKNQPCESCGIGKAKQKAVSKIVKERSNVRGERLFIDISSVKAKSYGQRKFWLMVMDDCTDYCWSYFLKQKSELQEEVIKLIKDLKMKENIQVKYIRCDDAGENRKLEQECLKAGLGIQFEFTTPGTPQRNSRIERKFATLFGRVRSMMNAAKLPEDFRKGLWAECAATVTKTSNILVTANQTEPSFNLFYGKNAPYLAFTSFWRNLYCNYTCKKESTIQVS